MGRIVEGTANPRQTVFLGWYNIRRYNPDGSSFVATVSALSRMTALQIAYLNAPIATAEQLAGQDVDTSDRINPPLASGNVRGGASHGKTARITTSEQNTTNPNDLTRFQTIEFQVPTDFPNEYLANWATERNVDPAAPANGMIRSLKVRGGRRYDIGTNPLPPGVPAPPPAA